MELSEIKPCIRSVLAGKLVVCTTIARPSLTLPTAASPAEDSEMFESLFPGILDAMTDVIFEETFGNISGSPRMQAIRIKKFMEKHCD